MTEKKFVNKTNTQQRPDGRYADVLNKIEEDGVCPFCTDQLAKYHPNPITNEGEYWLATDSAYPYEGALEHLLFIHKEHIQDISEVSPESWTDLLALVKTVKTERKLGGAAIVFRFGDTDYTGATVSHLHMQLVSGSDDPDAEPITTRIGNKAT